MISGFYTKDFVSIPLKTPLVICKSQTLPSADSLKHYIEQCSTVKVMRQQEQEANARLEKRLKAQKNFESHSNFESSLNFKEYSQAI